MREYVSETYGVPLRHIIPEQKVIRACFASKRDRKRDSMRSVTRPIYLLPQFCYGTGLPEQARQDDQFKKKVRAVG